MFPAWTWIVGLFIGASIGSFLNALIYRMPRGLSISEPKNSFCPRCRARLTVLDLFPLLSWLFLRGKCRHCHAPISSRYFFIELFNGILFAAIWYQCLVLREDPWRAVCLAIFMSALVAAIGTDLAHYIIPDQLNATMWFAGVTYNIGLILQNDPKGWTWGMPSALAGWLVGAGLIWGIALLGRLLFGKDAMGHGDIKMMRGIGAMLFPMLTGFSLIIAVMCGMVVGIITIVARKAKPAAPEPETEDDDEEYVPESVGSLLKCGVGYFLLFDIVGLFFPKFYESYFGENPFAAEEIDENDEVSLTMIPFGPSLAVGAMIVVFFEPQVMRLYEGYLQFQGLK
ncbi:MAG: prepilin peptidase [Chthonomonas sp.]|nr:prepilin peptidase [Chthonomonas sp.]